MSFWTLIGLLAFSLSVTVITRWLVARLRGTAVPEAPVSFAAIISDLIWISLIFAVGMIATRYIERITNAAIGYLVFGCVAFFLSLARASLHQHAQERQWPRPKLDIQNLLHAAIHNLTYLLFSAIVYLALSLLVPGPAAPILFIPVCIGALLPDLDSQDSVIGTLLPFISRRLDARFGHLQEWHTLGAVVVVALLTAPLIAVIGLDAWLLIPVGFLSHLVLDMLQPRGIMLFWPLGRTRYLIFRGFVESLGDTAERQLVSVMAVVLGILFFVADVGPPPRPTSAVPSYESRFEYYRSLRGRNLVFADVDGTWQVTGRRVRARLEILNAVDDSFIMLDRYSGKVFTAGRTPTDNLYLNTINIAIGAAVRVKPVEVELRDEQLLKALPVVYQMQREPGLQYIYVFGELVVSSNQDETGSSLRVDYAQTQLRQIQDLGEGHYGLHYLTASDLIELANVSAEVADLVIVATYTDPTLGSTATPLPLPPPTAAPQQRNPAEQKSP